MCIPSSFASRLPAAVIDTLGEIINSKYVELVLKQDSSSLIFWMFKQIMKVQKFVHFRLYSDFLKILPVYN